MGMLRNGHRFRRGGLRKFDGDPQLCFRCFSGNRCAFEGRNLAGNEGSAVS
jgi:hypothetical protein